MGGGVNVATRHLLRPNPTPALALPLKGRDVLNRRSRQLRSMLCCAMLALTLFLLPGFASAALDFPALSGRVVDEAGILSPQGEPRSLPSLPSMNAPPPTRWWSYPCARCAT